MRGKHLLFHWASTQATIALSSAEAELNALVKAINESLGIQNMMKEMGKVVNFRVYTDSSAANCMVHRLGAGKVKHLEARQLWLQERVLKKNVKIEKVPRDQNSSDSLTHYWSAVDAKGHFARVGFEVCG